MAPTIATGGNRLGARTRSRAESLARAAATTLEKNAPTSAAVAYAILARAQAAQGKLQDAQQSSERSKELARQSGDLLAHFQAGLASANTAFVEGKKSDAANRSPCCGKKLCVPAIQDSNWSTRIRLAQPSNVGRLQSEA